MLLPVELFPGGSYPLWVDWSVITLLGLLLGSFTSCVVYRVPRDIPLWDNPFRRRATDHADRLYSFCPQCEHRLHVRDLLPVVSWLFLGGKCRYCRTPISPLYPGIELTTLLFCVTCFAVWQEWHWPLVILFAASPVIIGLFYIDALWRLLPDMLNLMLGVLGLCWIAATPLTLLDGMLGGVLLGGSFWMLRYAFWRIKHVEAMGLGDVKFVAAAGLWLGTQPLSLFLFLCGFVGIAYALVYRLVTREKLFPFGPALIIAWALCVILPYTPLKGFLTPFLLP